MIRDFIQGVQYLSIRYINNMVNSEMVIYIDETDNSDYSALLETNTHFI